MKDKAKKIFILGSVILITIIIIISAVIIINSKTNKAEENIEIISDYTMNDKLAEEKNQDTENSVTEESQEDITKTYKVSTKNTEDVVIENKIQVSKDKDVVVEKNEDQSKQEQSSNTTDKKVTETKKENNKSEDKAEDNKNENNSSNNDVNTNIDNNKNESINNDSDTNTDKEEINNTETKVVETFKYNDKMAKQIKSIIEANESEYMKKYGYNVTIDETIVNLTNQFTFTEDRVIDSLKYKFNTIRVYARDYYVNGVYMWTECFII